MTTGQDRSPHRDVNAEEPVYESDPPVKAEGTEDRRSPDQPGPVVAGRTAHSAVDSDENTPLLDPHDLDRFRTQWQELQGAFVDNPQDAVTKADSLVTETLEQLTSTFAQHKQRLDEQWSRGEDGDTEDLRRALRGYRDYFDRLLTI
ncbi:hypothetical protein [Nocardia sp. NPDC004722]